jgi:hypothetical protein
LIHIKPDRVERQDPPSMAKRAHDRTEENKATEEPPRTEEYRRVIEEYINDLREILKGLHRLFS